MKSLKAVYKNTYFIADAALYVAETIKALAEEEQLFITRVPQKLKEAKSVLACSLMVYESIEHLIREKLATENAHFPDMKNKPTQRPTARWVFFLFSRS